MPIYEYQCTECGDRIETMQRISDPPLTTCEKCQGELKKLISAPAFQFKGSGWYVTDYADKSKKGKDKDGKSGDAKDTGSSSGESKSSDKSSGSESGSKSSESSSKSGSSSSAES